MNISTNPNSFLNPAFANLGHSFYGDPGLFRLDQSALNIAINVGLVLFGLVIFVQFISGLGVTFSLIKGLFAKVFKDTKPSTARNMLQSPEVAELASLVLTSLEKFYNLEAES